ncbi:MAG: hypothetical protein R2697_17230 [Ilumatobacteraceae bacterium]
MPLATIGNLINLVIVVVSLVFLFANPLGGRLWRDLAAKTVVVDK